LYHLFVSDKRVRSRKILFSIRVATYIQHFDLHVVCNASSDVFEARVLEVLRIVERVSKRGVFDASRVRFDDHPATSPAVLPSLYRLGFNGSAKFNESHRAAPSS
jgi:hypothetical protein